MGVLLLDKTRKINRLLHDSNSQKVVFNDICSVLSDTLESNVLVLSRKGKILGIHNKADIEEIKELIHDMVGGYIDGSLNERFLNVLSTRENVNLVTFGFGFDKIAEYSAIVTPINIAGERLGTLFLYKRNALYGIDDIILSEYGTTVVGLEMIRSVHEESADLIRKKDIVQSAVRTLSYSELEAVTQIFNELDGMEGIIVGSRIAEKVGITRSVIVNSIRKFESAGIISSRSSGMKGTYIKVLNDVAFNELKEITKNQ